MRIAHRGVSPLAGVVDANGVVHLDGRDGAVSCPHPKCPLNLAARYYGLLNQAIEFALTPYRKSKSQKQLGWYWGDILPAISEYTGHTVEEMHAWCKYKFLNPPEFKTLVIVDRSTGEVVEESFVQMEDTVSKLTTTQMRDYCDDIRNFFAPMGVVIEDPDVNWKAKKRLKAAA